MRAQQRGGRVLRLNSAEPTKHAYVIDFIDESYRKPPVLFCDPKVAEVAQIGDMTHSIFANVETLAAEIKGGRLILDPVTVTERAQNFAENRSHNKELPPDDWLSLGQLAVLYGYHKDGLREYLSEILDDENLLKTIDPSEALFGEYHDPRSSGRKRKYYFSPRAVQYFAMSKDRSYIDFESVLPNGWITLDDLEDEFPPKVLKTMLHSVRISHAGLLNDHAITHYGTDYLSPKAQKVLRDGSVPNGFFIPTQELIAKYGVDESDLEHLCRDISRRTEAFGITPCWWMVDGEPVMHVAPILYKELKKELIELQSTGAQPITFMDGDIIDVHQKPRKQILDFLYKAFESAQTFEVMLQPALQAKLAKKSSKNSGLESIYAEEFRTLE